MKTVIAAIDLGPSSARVLYHAAGFARLLSGDLKVIHVNGTSAESRARVVEFCRRDGPYEIDLEDADVIVSSGLVSDAIVRESIRAEAGLVVVGSRGRGGIAKLILGSTSEAVLRSATMPVLLVPPNNLDIVNITDRTALTCGPVLAAIDLAERCDHQLELAANLAKQSGQPLLMITVAPMRLSEHAAGVMLRQRAHQLEGIKPRALIVRRGDIAEEISRCARAEGAGLVVMGLRARPRVLPGKIAAAVLKTSSAFVLAVPGC
jgi:nucleotide-binding universal stress UspA family protein